jgi:hypothetical protein
MKLSQADFDQYENLRSRFLEEIGLAGFSGDEALSLRIDVINFVQNHMMNRAQGSIVVIPEVVTETV